VVRVALALLVALALAPNGAAAQDPRLATRLDKPTQIAVNAIVDSARVAALPTAPLVDKALEGAAAGSDGPRIVVAVRNLSARMGAAKHVLGPHASADEIKAAAGAMDFGVTVRDLARLHAAAGKRPLTMPLAVLTDLLGRGVPLVTATTLVVQLTRGGIRDAELALFQRNVRLDIEHGADPAVAATTRSRGLMLKARPAGRPPE
jgi:hypothetical protein